MISEKHRLAGEKISEIITWLNRINQLSILPKLVLDIDETIFINFHKHWLVWKKWIEEQRFPMEELSLNSHSYIPVYDFADFCAQGGSMVYQQFFKDPQVFVRYNNENMMDPEFNRDLQPVSNIGEVMAYLQPLVEAYLTARPESMKQVSVEELAKHQLPESDRVICAGGSGVYLSPQGPKIEELQKIQAQHPGQKIILIDDSTTTFQAIQDLSDPNLQAILFNGAGTPKNVYSEAKDWLDVLLFLTKDLECLRSKILLQLLG